MVSVGSHLCLYEFFDAANVVALTGSKYGSTLLGSSGPPLRLGDETVTASDHVLTWRHHLVGSQPCEVRRYY